MSGKNRPAKNNPSELYISRVYDAPVKRVWEAWTDPEQVGKWWGPRGFTITTHSSNLKTGGHWHYTMHGPDGVDYVNKTKYLEVEKYSRLVYDHGGNDDRKPVFRVTVDFSEDRGKTTMEMTMRLDTAEAAAETKKFVKKAGGEATWDRLAEYLSPSDRFVINRSFDVSKERLFEAWTDPNQFSQWMPPTGFSMTFLRVNIATGGESFYCMTGEGAQKDIKMYGKAKYQEVVRPSRLTYTQCFCDESGQISRHPMAPTWPETLLTTVEFFEEGPNRARVAVTWEIFGDANDVERETFDKAKGGMTQGWSGSFDKLEDTLAKVG